MGKIEDLLEMCAGDMDQALSEGVFTLDMQIRAYDLLDSMVSETYDGAYQQ